MKTYIALILVSLALVISQHHVNGEATKNVNGTDNSKDNNNTNSGNRNFNNNTVINDASYQPAFSMAFAGTAAVLVASWL